MSKTDENHRYQPYYRAKPYHNDRRYDDDEHYKRPYKKTNKHHYQYHDNRNYNDFSYRRSYRHDYRHQYSKPKSKSHSYFSTPPRPLMSTSLPPPVPPVHPPPPPPVLTVVPHERESWIRSVKKTKVNESTEQKTQYLETMLRMPQQKAALSSSRFDRMRFADDQLVTTTTTATTVTSTTDDNLVDNSFHLIGDINNYEDIRTLERILFNNDLGASESNPTGECPKEDSLPTPPPLPVVAEVRPDPMPCSGFLIDNCDEEEAPPLSPPPRPLLPPIDDLNQQNADENDDGLNEQRVMLVSELDAAEAERKRELKRQKRLQQRLQKKKKTVTVASDTTQPETKSEDKDDTPLSDNDKPESLADWIVEYDTNTIGEVCQLTDEVRRTSTALNDEDKTAKVNMILLKIKKQQKELNRLRQYVMSMLGEQSKSRPSKITRANTNIAHDLLLAFLNQPSQSGCWLCSGKMYAEVATQCNHDDNQ